MKSYPSGCYCVQGRPETFVWDTPTRRQEGLGTILQHCYQDPYSSVVRQPVRPGGLVAGKLSARLLTLKGCLSIGWLFMS